MVVKETASQTDCLGCQNEDHNVVHPVHPQQPRRGKHHDELHNLLGSDDPNARFFGEVIDEGEFKWIDEEQHTNQSEQGQVGGGERRSLQANITKNKLALPIELKDKYLIKLEFPLST